MLPEEKELEVLEAHDPTKSYRSKSYRSAAQLTVVDHHCSGGGRRGVGTKGTVSLSFARKWPRRSPRPMRIRGPRPRAPTLPLSRRPTPLESTEGERGGRFRADEGKRYRDRGSGEGRRGH